MNYTRGKLISFEIDDSTFFFFMKFIASFESHINELIKIEINILLNSLDEKEFKFSNININVLNDLLEHFNMKDENKNKNWDKIKEELINDGLLKENDIIENNEEKEEDKKEINIEESKNQEINEKNES